MGRLKKTLSSSQSVFKDVELEDFSEADCLLEGVF